MRDKVTTFQGDINMFTGQLAFYSGVALLFFTIILGIIFWVKKPQYIPENATYDGGTDRNTRKLRSGYPTDRLTVQKEEKQAVARGAAVIQEGTERLEEDRCRLFYDTEMLPDDGRKEIQGTEKLLSTTSHLAEKVNPPDTVATDAVLPTERLQETVPLAEQQTELLGTQQSEAADLLTQKGDGQDIKE